MCLLSVYNPGAVIDRDHLLNGAECNPDGYGFAVAVDGRIEIGHGMDAVAVVEAFTRVRESHPDTYALFHSRYTTDGTTTVDNCHPFFVGGDARTVLAHNGVLPAEAIPAKGDDRSDTRILAESLIPRGMFGIGLHRARVRRNLRRWMLRNKYPNKIAILSVDPRYQQTLYILNEDAGTWVDGVWHSNSGYLPRTRTYGWSTIGGTGYPTSTDPLVREARARWISGEISYSEYLDTYYGINRKKHSNDCPICESYGSVNLQYGYCTICKVCIDCFYDIEECDCYTPGVQRDAIKAEILAMGTPMALTGPPPVADRDSATEEEVPQ